MTEPKRQHIVSRLYLENFTDNRNRLWSFDIETGNVRQSKAREAAVISRFYNLKGEQTDRLEIENELSKIGTAARPVITALLAKQLITPDQKEALSVYIGTQLTRVPSFKKAVDHSHDQYIQGYRERQHERYKKLGRMFHPTLSDSEINEMNAELIAQTDELLQSPFYKDINADSTLRTMMNLGKQLARAIASGEWTVCHTDEELITTDTPATIFPIEWKPVARLLHLSTLPLSTHTALVISPTPGSIRFVSNKNSREWTTVINTILAQHAERFVYGSSEEAVKKYIKK